MQILPVTSFQGSVNFIGNFALGRLLKLGPNKEEDLRLDQLILAYVI